MRRHSYRVLIIGGGVAGLTAAIALRRAGHDPLIFERAERLQPLGAGLILWSNSFTALRQLGLESQMLAIGAPLARLSVRTPSGAVLSSTDARTLSERVGAPTLSVHRADLLEMLQRQIPDQSLHLGRTFSRFEVTNGRVVAHFENGHEEEGDILLGADGIRSTVRAQVHGASEPRYAGYTAWRSVIPREPQRIVRTLESTETWGRGTRFGWVPMSNDRVYWFAVKAAPPGETAGPSGHRAELLELFGDWHSPIPETLDASEESAIVRHDIYDRPPISNWGTGPVTLAGDAAHPTTPNLGQGAAMAIEDAVVLAHCLNQYATVDAALRGYESQRSPRATMITNQSYRMGIMAQLEHPLATRLRNSFMRLLTDRIAAAQVQQIVSWKPPGLKGAES